MLYKIWQPDDELKKNQNEVIGKTVEILNERLKDDPRYSVGLWKDTGEYYISFNDDELI